jgi:bifunctional DNA-binding transcriptional regulator/antitoxin component of YhaV-PrlF toxin-antitoxin module
MTTIKMGKRGTLVLPVKFRRQLGIEDGSILITEAKDGEIRIRPAVAVEAEIYTPERRAELLLNNATTREEWDAIAADVRSWGLDPQNLPYVDKDQRDQLPTNRELDERIAKSRAAHGTQRLSA